jgi:hypothetical protein
VSKKADHPLLGYLLAAATVYRDYLAAARRTRRQLGWVVELAHLLRTQDDAGQPRQARQVKREVKAFFEQLERDTAADPQDASMAQHLIRAIRSRWWGLFTCYRVPGLPPTNNEQETFFNRLKQSQRRISGRKSVHEFVVRYGAYAAYIDPSEAFDQLLERLCRVSDAEFQSARQSWRENESPLHKAHRFHYHRAKFLKELEADWEELARCSLVRPRSAF